MKKTILAAGVLGLIAALGLGGCGGKMQERLIGTEELVESSEKKPNWIKGSGYCAFEEKRLICMGLSDDTADLEVATRVAEIEGVRRIVEDISRKIREEGMRGLSGPQREHVGKFFESATSWVSENIQVSGARLTASYWEKNARYEGTRVHYYYRAYGLMEISTTDYQSIRDRIAQGFIDRAVTQRDRQAEQAARQAKERLLLQ